MAVLARLGLCRALSGLIVDCVSNRYPGRCPGLLSCAPLALDPHDVVAWQMQAIAGAFSPSSVESRLCLALKGHNI
jgi:hypothetical protein